MADKTLFGRLKKILGQSTVVRRVGDNKLKVIDPARAQSAGNLETNMLVDRYNRLHSTPGGSSVYDPSQGFNQLRNELFKDYESMDNDSIISAALDVYADESTLKNEFGDILEIKSGKKEIQQVLHNLFYDVLNIEFNLYPWIRMMCKYGDFYLHLKIVDKLGVVGVSPLSPYAIARQEGIDPQRPEAVEFIYDETFGGVTGAYGKTKNGNKIYENYEIAHFRLLQDTNFLPYGKSMIEQPRKTWKQLTLMEDAMMIHRIMRAPQKRAFKIDIGNIPPAEVDAYMQKVINKMKKVPYMDKQSGEYNMKFNIQNMIEDFYLPVRGGNSNTSIEDIGGLEWTGVDDVEYLRNRMMAGLRVPKAFLGYDENVEGKATLAAEDVRFSRTIERIQRIFVSELTKIAIVHLYSQGYTDEELVDFSLQLTNPSTIAEQEKLDVFDKKVSLADAIKNNKMLSEDWIYDNIWKMSKDEVELEREKVVEDIIQVYRQDMIQQNGEDPAKEKEISEKIKKKNRATLSASGDTKKTRGGKSDSDVGRPEEDVDYGTQRAPRGRDPLGSETKTRDVKNRDRSIKFAAKEVLNMLKNDKKVALNEQSMLDENNLLSDEDTKE
jgi:hypothetical protein|tara:strand:- start:2393 stop:4216 length:1824 start_codon:yes stop_codon:yes gene_type:complete